MPTLMPCLVRKAKKMRTATKDDVVYTNLKKTTEAVEVAIGEGCTAQGELDCAVDALIALMKEGFEQQVLTVMDVGGTYRTVEVLCEAAELCAQARHFDICRECGFAPIYAKICHFFSDYFIPYVEQMEKKSRGEGKEVDYMHSFWMEAVERVVQVKTPERDRELLLAGNRARLALEHAMFVGWLVHNDVGGVYDAFKRHLAALHNSGMHYRTGGDIENADDFGERRRDWNP